MSQPESLRERVAVLEVAVSNFEKQAADTIAVLRETGQKMDRLVETMNSQVIDVRERMARMETRVNGLIGILVLLTASGIVLRMVGL